MNQALRHSLLSLTAISLTAICLACQSGGGAATQNKEASVRPAPYAERHLAKPQHLPEEMRAAIARSMKAHGDDVTMLLWSILFLDLDAAGDSAKAIAARPPMVRSSDADHSRVPPRIVELGAELDEQANHLVELAKATNRDPEAFAKSFGELAQTCVRCHSVYLYEKHDEAAAPTP